MIDSHESPCEVCNRIGLCITKENPCLVADMESGYAVLGDSQFFEGYCLLLCKKPVECLDDLNEQERMTFFMNASVLASAIKDVTGCERVNIELLGNSHHHLHWHLFPRRITDPLPGKPVWVQMPLGEEAEKSAFSPERHSVLINTLRVALRRNSQWGLK